MSSFVGADEVANHFACGDEEKRKRGSDILFGLEHWANISFQQERQMCPLYLGHGRTKLVVLQGRYEGPFPEDLE